MRFYVKDVNPLLYKTPALLVGVCEGGINTPLLKAIDKSLGGVLTTLNKSNEFTGKLNSTKTLHTLGRMPAERIVFVGLGPDAELTPERIRQGTGSAVQAIKGSGISRCSVIPAEPKSGKYAIAAMIEGIMLANYHFALYKSEKSESISLQEVDVFVTAAKGVAAAEQVIAETKTICEAVYFARDLVSQPGNVATPGYLAEKALEMSGKCNLKCRILEWEELVREGMEALLAVGKGSRQLPKMILLEYWGESKNKRPVTLVGKGITFDSGGISLKPREGMELMKTDMAGGAAVMATMMAAANLKLPVNLVAVIPTAENMPDGAAYKPGDVIKSMSGQTIEITNTDAEGRMILCDALHFALRYKPAVVVDVATLTGACVVALGHVASGLMGNDPALLKQLSGAGEVTGERLWELPTWDEYNELFKSDIADLKNAGGPHAGTIYAACFLKKFVGSARWAHLDIAGTAWEEKGRAYLPKGATGVGVRLLVEFLKRS